MSKNNESATHQYCIVRDNDPGDEGLEPNYSFYSIWDDDDIEQLAEVAAEDFHRNHDGWEASWPVKFAIFDMKGKLLGKCEVELEYSPQFSAGKVE